MEDKGYARCKACDRSFYPSWSNRLGSFEELCHVCLPLAFSSESDDSDFIEGYLMDKDVHKVEGHGGN